MEMREQPADQAGTYAGPGCEDNVGITGISENGDSHDEG
jgi:hypothetical protein